MLRPTNNTGSKAGAQTYALPVSQDRLLHGNRRRDRGGDRGLKTLEGVEAIGRCGSLRLRCCRDMCATFGSVGVTSSTCLPSVSLNAFRTSSTPDHLVRMLLRLSHRFRRSWVVGRIRTLAEDMDPTWTLDAEGHGVRFVPEALPLSIEPHGFHGISVQATAQWSYGSSSKMSVIAALLDQPYLRSILAVHAGTPPSL